MATVLMALRCGAKTGVAHYSIQGCRVTRRSPYEQTFAIRHRCGGDGRSGPSGSGVRCGHRPGITRWPCATGVVARLPGEQPVGPVQLVSRGSAGADRQSSCESSGLGQQRLPHLLVRLSRAGQRGAEHLRGACSAATTSTAAGLHSAAAAGTMLVPLHPGTVLATSAGPSQRVRADCSAAVSLSSPADAHVTKPSGRTSKALSPAPSELRLIRSSRSV